MDLPGYDAWKLAAPPCGDEPCRDCDGRGWHEDEDGRFACDECDGTGAADMCDDGQVDMDWEPLP